MSPADRQLRAGAAADLLRLPTPAALPLHDRGFNAFQHFFEHNQRSDAASWLVEIDLVQPLCETHGEGGESGAEGHESGGYTMDWQRSKMGIKAARAAGLVVAA